MVFWIVVCVQFLIVFLILKEIIRELSKLLWLHKTKSIIDVLIEDLVLRILSFLTLEELYEFMNVSSQCRELVYSLSEIRIDSRDITQNRRQKYANLMRWYWRKHPDPSRVKTLGIYWLFTDDDNREYEKERNEIERWVHEAVEHRNIRVINIDLYYSDDHDHIIYLKLPVNVYECQSLKQLTANWIVLQLPATGFSSLLVLNLAYITVNSVNWGEWISENCRILEELKLENVDGTEALNLTSSSLKRLKIHNDVEDDLLRFKISCVKLDYLRIFFRSNSDETSLEINAPILSTLKLLGDIFNKYIFRDFYNLQDVDLFGAWNPFRRTQYVASMDIKLEKILSSVQQAAQSFTTNGMFLKPVLERNLKLPTFSNAWFLNLYTSQDCPTILSFVRVFPNLITLDITCDQLGDLLPLQSAFLISQSIKSQVLKVIRQLEDAEIIIGENIIHVEADEELGDLIIKLARVLGLNTPQTQQAFQ